MNKPKRGPNAGEDIAIVGMAVNLPGAGDIESYWLNLRAGVESIRRLTEEELLAAGEDPARMARRNYVPAAAPLDNFDTFDADFFGFSPKDAAILDPQHRKFLEVAWEAMEQAGHPPESVAGEVGVYAGCGMGSYFYFNICSNPDLVEDVGMFLLRHTGNDKDFLSTRVSHIFDLKGPSLNIQTACSTSLVAIHQACAALRAGEIGMALAGGVTIDLPQGRGYEFKENEILSPDGHCHAFDHRAQGTVFGSGAGCVALRRLSDALADGDPIWAVIKGSAVNNDGAAKAGYLAPSVEGQVAAITSALDAAGVAAQSIGMVECHGTGTYLGDPIEVAALTEAYRRETRATDFARIGSVKTNIGHLDTAAGVAGLAKAALSLTHGQIPPSLGYEAPNPAIPFDGSPFRVNDHLSDWPAQAAPRRAAINALGVGGTNAHMILEEAPARTPSEDSDWPFHVLCVSGQSKAALEANTAALAAHLRAHPDQPLADISYTLKEGRRAFDRRRVVVAETHAEAADLLEAMDTRRVFTHAALGQGAEVVFMFPGGGAQYPDMARDLYETEPVFAEWMDRGLDHLAPQLDYDVRSLWLPEPEARAAAAQRLKKPSAQLPLIAIVEYALAQLWMSWGVQPAAMIGHSMGENVAACLAGVMRFEDLIDLVLLRGQLFDEVPAGGMISISAPLDRITPLLGSDLDIASINAAELIAVSGPDSALDGMQQRLAEADIDYQRIAIDIAAHSRMLSPILDRYRSFLAGLDLKAPGQEVISNRTGQPLTAQEATDPDYWVGQLRNTVEFARGIEQLAQHPARVFLEVGPGKALSALAQMSPDLKPDQVFSTLRHPDHAIADDLYFLSVIGRLWACGVEADWTQIWGEARRNRVILPTYRFQRARYFIEPGKAAAATPEPRIERRDDIAEWGYVPHWKKRYADLPLDPATDLAAQPLTWLVFEDQAGRAAPALEHLRAAGHEVITVTPADSFARRDDHAFTLAPEQGRIGYDQLLSSLGDAGRLPDRIAHFWLADDQTPPRPGSSPFDRHLEQGFWSLTWLAQSLAETAPEGPLHLTVFTSGAAQVAAEPLDHPEKALVTGPVGVLPREVPGITASLVDLPSLSVPRAEKSGWFAKADPAPVDETLTLLEELLAAPANTEVALRDGTRFEKHWRATPLPAAEGPTFQAGGTYLITGGFGGIGQTLAADILAAGANVVLLSRAKMPAPEEWSNYLAQKGSTDATARRIQQALRLQETAGRAGARLDVAQGDVANLAQMRRVIEEIGAGEGKLTGVIHAAGHLADAPLLGKDQAQIDAVLGPKVQGLRVLDQLLPDGTLDLMVLFSSTSTATRGAGQVDYVAANAWLDAFAAARSGGKTRVVTINWGIWSDVGMAAKALPGATVDALPPRPVAAALIDSTTTDAEGAPLLSARIGTDHWLMDEHRTRDGQAILPGTGYIELLAEAAQAQGFGQAVEISDLYFLRALPLETGENRDLEITLTPADGTHMAEVRSACQVGGKRGWQLHAQATLRALEGDSPEPLPLADILARCPERAEAAAGDRLRAAQEGHLNFGPNWHVLQSTALGTGEGLASLHLPEGAQGEDHLLHAGLLDIATGWAMYLIPGYGAAHLWVPLSYASLRIHAPLTRAIRSWARLVEADSAKGQARFDVTLTDPQGRVLVEVEGFAMQRLEGGFAIPPLSASEIRFDGDASGTEALTPAEERLAWLVSQGIRRDEGPQALRRALAANRSQIVVSSLPLPGLVAQADTPPLESRGSGQSFERPDLDGSFVAPRNGVEAGLAEIWEGLLGVSPVGVEDSFFDLGGHSLIAVRLFAAVKRRFSVEFPISVLFEAPTIAQLAALIGTDEASESDSTAAPQSYDYLVPLNSNSDARATPLFIVAGMFGNVLNLRHLALPFSNERPVYGIQARGLIGDLDPHRDACTAAADYLAEVRRRQPEGPYLLSGYSGGGVVAYEMAQQLRNAGEQVAVLALLDSPLPVRPSLKRTDKALIKLAELRRKGPAYLAEWLRNRRAWQEEQRARAGQVEVADGVSFNNDRISSAFIAAMEAYQTQPWEGPITLFRPPLDRHWAVSGGMWVTRAKEYVFEDNDWRRYAPALQVIEVPGDHDSMVLAPNVTVLAQELREIIEASLEAPDETWQEATAAE